MLTIFVLTFSIFFQLAAAVMAIKLIRITERRVAWSLISAALVFMSIRRVIPLSHLLFGNPSYPVDFLNEVIGLLLSFLMMTGMAGIAPLFLAIKRSEKKLRESENKFRKTLAEMDTGYYSVTLDGILLEHNPTCNRILGIDPALDMRGSRLPEFWQDENQRNAYLDELMTKGFIRNYVIPAKKITGEKIFTMANAHLIKDEKNNPVRIDGNFTDITEQKQAEETQQKNEALLKEVGQIAKIGGWEMDLTTRKARWTSGTYDIVELDPGESPPGPDEHVDFYLPEYRSLVVEAMRALIEENEPLNFTALLRTAKGNIKWCQAFGRAVHEGGKCLKIYGTFQDITEHKRAEEEIIKLNEELESRVTQRTAQLEFANKELEAFSYSVSHDLRAPLRHIIGYSELLREVAVNLNEKSQSYLNNILESAQRMGDLIDDLLSFSRMGRVEMQKRTINTEQLVKDVINELSNQTKDRNIVWSIGKLPNVHGDPAMLQLVFTNLFSNAIKFTRPCTHAQIDIGSNVSGNSETIFFVRDNGVGFDMKYADQLFGVFQRLHSIHDFEGTGIGLANVKRIVLRHGGRVWAEGTVNGGATFHFSLPD